MAEQENVQKVIDLLTPHLKSQTHEESGSIVVITCGISGSGKSTTSKAIVKSKPSFTRLSIDALVADSYGIYNVDYPASEYEAHLEEASALYSKKFHELLEQKKNIVLDRSFYAKEDRDEYRAAVEHAGGRAVLVYFKAERELLWKRIRERREKGVNADSAREISLALLDSFVQGFEAPDGEGEIVVTVERG